MLKGIRFIVFACAYLQCYLYYYQIGNLHNYCLIKIFMLAFTLKSRLMISFIHVCHHSLFSCFILSHFVILVKMVFINDSLLPMTGFIKDIMLTFKLHYV